MPEVCLDKTIESCLKVVLSKTLPTPRKIHKMLMNGGDGKLVAEQTHGKMESIC